MDRVPGTPAAEVRANLAGLRITPANVLQVRNALLAESQLMRDQIAMMRMNIGMGIGRPGLERVSERAETEFNAKIGALLEQWASYVEALKAGAEELGRAARRYGHTEDQVAASFRQFQRDNPPPTSPGSPR